jgi:beta-lactamase class A
MRPRAFIKSLKFSYPLLLILLPALARAQATATQEVIDPVLHSKLEHLLKGFAGDAGIYVRHLPSGRSAAIRADELFPTASMIKVPILCALFDRIDRGELKYDQDLLYRDSLKYDDGITGSFRDSTKITLSQIVMLMISVSDNTAALWCQQLAGTGTAINDWLEQNGFHRTRVNSRTPGRKANWEAYGWGQTTPREMAELMVRIREAKAVSPDASEEMYRVLTKPYWDREAISQIPPGVQVASKNGAVDASRSEAVLVNAPSGDYVICVMTKNQRDQRWEPDNEGYVLIRNVSRTLWQHFEPTSQWKPQRGLQKWTK